MTNIWSLSDSQRRKDFIREWRADLAEKLQSVAVSRELHEMDCRECANEEYGAVVAANEAHVESLSARYRSTPCAKLRGMEEGAPHQITTDNLSFDN